jgi:16S rRNA (guanine527-N7)-methyltransferase
MQRDEFLTFIKNNFPEKFQVLMQQFDAYFSWLVEENQKINLISRQTAPEEIWTLHFLDSLLSIDYIDFTGKKILDFGTGGGLPGIPLAILYPNATITLLDSRKKKIQSIRGAAESLKLNNCFFIDTRLEEIPKKLNGTFDIIVSRSVKILPEFRKPLLNLLKKDGKLVFYKSKILDDLSIFDGLELHDAGTLSIGERKIIVVEKSKNS